MQGIFHYGRVHTRAHTIARTHTHIRKGIRSLRSRVCLRTPPSLQSPAPAPLSPLALPAGGLPLRKGAPFSLPGVTPSPFGALWGCPPTATTSPPPSASIGGVPGFAPHPSLFVGYRLVLRAGGSLATLACLPAGSVNRPYTSHRKKPLPAATLRHVPNAFSDGHYWLRFANCKPLFGLIFIALSMRESWPPGTASSPAFPHCPRPEKSGRGYSYQGKKLLCRLQTISPPCSRPRARYARARGSPAAPQFPPTARGARAPYATLQRPSTLCSLPLLRQTA